MVLAMNLYLMYDTILLRNKNISLDPISQSHAPPFILNSYGQQGKISFFHFGSCWQQQKRKSHGENLCKCEYSKDLCRQELYYFLRRKSTKGAHCDATANLAHGVWRYFSTNLRTFTTLTQREISLDTFFSELHDFTRSQPVDLQLKAHFFIHKLYIVVIY